MSIFDSHCHPQFPQYDNDRDEMLARAKGAGVSMICVGTDYRTSKQAIELAGQYDHIWASVGLHPNDNLDEQFNAQEYEELLKQPKVVAMGEIGLDYYRTTEELSKKFQRERFDKQLQLASKINVPVIIHSRDAGKGSVGIVHQDLLSILKNNLPPRLGVAHSFTGTLEEAKQYLDLGFYIGFNGIITFARQYDEMLRFVPLDRILLETDAPYLTPEPHRGQRNEPVYIIEVAKKIAELKNELAESVIEKTTKNCKNLFNIHEI
ncbi:TatD family hydrolase [Candidatus Parcubacteria bacterium]|nr:TatD family hydrolase [Candidatus Parcubacteria bacterium]